MAPPACSLAALTPLPLLSLPDVNECEMSLALCGGFPCENVDGSFLCICPNDNEEFDPVTNQCRSRGNRTGLELTGTRGSSFYFPIIQERGFPLNERGSFHCPNNEVSDEVEANSASVCSRTKFIELKLSTCCLAGPPLNPGERPEGLHFKLISSPG